MVNKLLAEVPPRFWDDGQRGGAYIVDADFNVAGWLRLKGKGVACLLLCYEDDAGRHSCTVEHCAVRGESTPLMSGRVTVRLTGRLTKVEVVLKLTSDDMHFHVDELLVQREKRGIRSERMVSRIDPADPFHHVRVNRTRTSRAA